MPDCRLSIEAGAFLVADCSERAASRVEADAAGWLRAGHAYVLPVTKQNAALVFDLACGYGSGLQVICDDLTRTTARLIATGQPIFRRIRLGEGGFVVTYEAAPGVRMWLERAGAKQIGNTGGVYRLSACWEHCRVLRLLRDEALFELTPDAAEILRALEETERRELFAAEVTASS